MKATDVPEIQESGRRLPVDITWQTIVKLVAILAFLGASLGLFFWLIKSGKLQEFLHWLEHIGFWGNLLLVAILIPLCFPATFGYSVISMSCGFLYGILLGWLTITIGTTIGSVLAFIVFRRGLEHRVQSYVDSTHKLKVLLRALEHHQIKFGIMLRYTPLPVGIQTAIFALSHMPFWKFFVISFIALLPEEFMWAFAGQKAQDLSAIIKGEENLGPLGIVLFVGEICILVAIITTVIIIGRKALREAEEEAAQEDRESGVVENGVENNMPVDFGIVITEEPVELDTKSVELEETNSSQFSEPTERSELVHSQEKKL
jgi:uncharacterized membrane protein YdjX (TVP38/TMEM64 family)